MDEKQKSSGIFINIDQAVTPMTDPAKTKTIPLAKKIGIVLLVVMVIIAIFYYKATGGGWVFNRVFSYFEQVGNEEASKMQTPPPLIYQGTNTFTTTDWSEEILGFNGLKFSGTVVTSNLWYDVMFDRDTNQIYHCYPRELDPAAVARFTNPFTSIQFKVTPGHDQTTGKIIWVMRP